jgi:hypothetical protein
MTEKLEDERLAENELRLATINYERTKLLPKEIGARVQWKSNKVIWRRVGPNSWLPENGTDRDAPSKHIANTEFEVLPSLPETSLEIFSSPEFGAHESTVYTVPAGAKLRTVMVEGRYLRTEVYDERRGGFVTLHKAAS